MKEESASACWPNATKIRIATASELIEGARAGVVVDADEGRLVVEESQAVEAVASETLKRGGACMRKPRPMSR